MVNANQNSQCGIDMVLAQGNILGGTISLPEALTAEHLQITAYTDSGYCFNQDIAGLNQAAGSTLDYNLLVAPSAGYRLTYTLSSDYTGNRYVGYAFYRAGKEPTTNYYNSSFIDLSSGNATDIDFSLLTGKTISGSISLPDNYVLPEGGLEISIFAQAGNGENVSASLPAMQTGSR
jgi:hypothetical protein